MGTRTFSGSASLFERLGADLIRIEFGAAWLYGRVDRAQQRLGFTVAVVELYTGSLGEPGSGADTLIGMLLVDAERIASALG